MMDAELWFKPELDVVAVEFDDRGRGLAPFHRMKVTFRDGVPEFVDVRAPGHFGTAELFAAAITEAVAQRRTRMALQAQYESLRSQWFAYLGCTHRDTVAIQPDPLNGDHTVRCVHCGSLAKRAQGGAIAGTLVWSHVFSASVQGRPYTAAEIEMANRLERRA